MIIEMRLTEIQSEILTDILENYNDRGPRGQGWQSDELTLLRDIVSYSISEAEEEIKGNKQHDQANFKTSGG